MKDMWATMLQTNEKEIENFGKKVTLTAYNRNKIHVGTTNSERKNM